MAAKDGDTPRGSSPRRAMGSRKTPESQAPADVAPRRTPSATARTPGAGADTAPPATARSPATAGPGAAGSGAGGGHPGTENRGTGSAAQGTPRGASPRASWTEAPRRPELGLRPVENLLARFTRPVFRKRSPAGATLMTDWPQLVGPALAAVTQPLRLVRGTLTVACSGPVAMELQHLGPQLMGRINSASGAVIVEALRFVQQAPATRPQHRPAPKPVTLPEPLTARLDGVQHPELRAALEKMAKGVYRKR